jgi:CMP-N-acetylneuraminic acid synthetase
MNNDPNALKANTKMLKPVYKACSAFIIAHKSRILNENTYWSLTKDDPHIYAIDESEAVDIDTELDFQIAERLYQLRKPEMAT